jgi:hypothetical protein
MDRVLESEKCPRMFPLNIREKKFYDLKEKSENKELIEQLAAVSVQYEKIWNLPVFLEPN